MSFAAHLINGISLGSVYALIALGYTMVYGIAKMLNFAHGDVIMVGGYAVFVGVSNLGMNPLAAIVVSMAVCTVLGVTIERVAYRPLRVAACRSHHGDRRQLSAAEHSAPRVRLGHEGVYKRGDAAESGTV